MFEGLQHKAETICPVIGQIITDITIDHDANDGNGALHMQFANGAELVAFDRGQDCCENRYLHTSDVPSEYVGEKLVDVYLRDTEEIPDLEVHEVAFLIIQTDRGHFVLETHNEHNGYYGGFIISVEVTPPA